MEEIFFERGTPEMKHNILVIIETKIHNWLYNIHYTYCNIFKHITIHIHTDRNYFHLHLPPPHNWVFDDAISFGWGQAKFPTTILPPILSPNLNNIIKIKRQKKISVCFNSKFFRYSKYKIIMMTILIKSHFLHKFIQELIF